MLPSQMYLCRTLSPAGDCGQALFGQKAFSSAAAVSQSWQGLIGSNAAVTASAATLPFMAELGSGEMTGTALLEGLYAHMQTSAPELEGMRINFLRFFAVGASLFAWTALQRLSCESCLAVAYLALWPSSLLAEDLIAFVLGGRGKWYDALSRLHPAAGANRAMHEGGVAHRAKDIKKKRIMERKNAKRGAKGPKPRPGSATQVIGTLAVTPGPTVSVLQNHSECS